MDPEVEEKQQSSQQIQQQQSSNLSQQQQSPDLQNEVNSNQLLQERKKELLLQIVRYKYEKQKREKQKQSEQQQSDMYTTEEKRKQLQMEAQKDAQMIAQIQSKGLDIRKTRTKEEVRQVFEDIALQLKMWTLNGYRYMDGVLAINFGIRELDKVKDTMLFSNKKHLGVAGINESTADWIIGEIEGKLGWAEIRKKPLPDPQDFTNMCKYTFDNQTDYEIAYTLLKEELQITNSSITPSKLHAIMDVDEKLFLQSQEMETQQKQLQNMSKQNKKESIQLNIGTIAKNGSDNDIDMT
eukprot:408263_1